MYFKRLHLCLGVAVLCSLSIAQTAFAQTANGSKIQFPNNEYWLVRDSSNNELCQGSGNALSAGNVAGCANLAAGTYTVYNLTTGSSGVAVTISGSDGEGTGQSDPVANGNQIEFPNNDWWLVRDSSNNELCQGAGNDLNAGSHQGCASLSAGTYTAYNLSTQAAGVVVAIEGGTGGTGGTGTVDDQPVANGSLIQFPNNNWWLVRDSNNNELCQGAGNDLSAGSHQGCASLSAGTYSAYDLSTEAAGVVVTIEGDPDGGGNTDTGDVIPLAGYAFADGDYSLYSELPNGNYGSVYSTLRSDLVATMDDETPVSTGNNTLTIHFNHPLHPSTRREPLSSAVVWRLSGECLGNVYHYNSLPSNYGEDCNAHTERVIFNPGETSFTVSNVPNGKYIYRVALFSEYADSFGLLHDTYNSNQVDTSKNLNVYLTRETSKHGQDRNSVGLLTGDTPRPDLEMILGADGSPTHLLWTMPMYAVDGDRAPDYVFQINRNNAKITLPGTSNTRSQVWINHSEWNKLSGSPEVGQRSRSEVNGIIHGTTLNLYEDHVLNGWGRRYYSYPIAREFVGQPPKHPFHVGENFTIQAFLNGLESIPRAQGLLDSNGNAVSFDGKTGYFATVPSNIDESELSENTIVSFKDADKSFAERDGWFNAVEWDFDAVQPFNEEFTGTHGNLLKNRGDTLQAGQEHWYFAGIDAPNGLPYIYPAGSRDDTYNDEEAVFVRDGSDSFLRMTIDNRTTAYSYMASASQQVDDSKNYYIDASNGVFLEASVKLDKATPADYAWWALWLMTPGGNLAYDDNIDTGSEVDLLEFVPDMGNGYNAAVFKDLPPEGEECNSPARSANYSEGRSNGTALRPDGQCFSYAAQGEVPGLGASSINNEGQCADASCESLSPELTVNYMDGKFHRIGMYYDHTRFDIYIDDLRIFHTTDPAWITKAPELSIRLTWELQTGLISANQWHGGRGVYRETNRDDDPAVYIDWVKVWEKKGSCIDCDDPELGRATASARDIFPLDKPAVPSPISPQTGAELPPNTDFEVSFTDSETADTYVIQRYDRNITKWSYSTSFSADDICSGGECTSTVPGVDTQANSIWRVRATNELGHSWMAPQYLQVVDPALVKPIAPILSSPLNRVNVEPETDVVATFQPIDGMSVDRYQVQRFDRIALKWSYNEIHPATICTGATCSVTLPGVSVANNHLWRVRGYNPRGWGAWSVYAYFDAVPSNLAKPTARTAVSPINRAVKGAGDVVDVVFSHLNDQYVDRYQVLSFDRTLGRWTGNKIFKVSDICDVTQCTAQVPGVPAQYNAAWRVRGYNLLGWGSWSSIAYYDVQEQESGSERENAMRSAIDALESYKNEFGSYKVENSGWRGNGSGWFFYDAGDYPNSVADALTTAGHPVIDTDPLYVNSSSTQGDFLIYHCNNRVALFSRHGSDQETTSTADKNWWDTNSCPRHPLDSLNADFFMLSQ